MDPLAERFDLSVRVADELLAGKTQLEGALALLWQSHRYAEQLACSRWELAVELAGLLESGASTSDVRFLIGKGMVHHGLETTVPGDKRRHFRRGRSRLCRRSCFVLSDDGVQLLAGRSGAKGEEGTPGHSVPGDGSSNGCVPPPENGQPLPQWDSSRHELRVGGRLVKQFKQPSPNQETILMAFEEEHWPARIDDPLPPAAEQCPKRRLHDAIKCLNRNHKSRLVRFRGDGTGEGVVWEYFASAARAES